jgi:hypothetical protein
VDRASPAALALEYMENGGRSPRKGSRWHRYRPHRWVLKYTNSIGHTCNIRRTMQRLGGGAASGMHPHAGSVGADVPKALSQPRHGTAQRSARALSPEVSALEVFTSARQRLSLVVPSSVGHQHQVSVSDDGRRLTHTRTPLGSHSHSVRLPMDSAVQRLLARLMVALE